MNDVRVSSRSNGQGHGWGIVLSVLAAAALLLGLAPTTAHAETQSTADQSSAAPERRADQQEKAAARKARKLLRQHRDAVQAEDSSFAVTDIIVDPNGTSHVRFDRTYRDLPVLGGDLVVHLDQGGELVDVSQTLAAELTVGTNPSISADAAAAAAGASGPTHTELVVDATGPNPYLAWAVGEGGTQGDGTPSRLTTYVDAHSGRIVRDEQGIHTAEGHGIGYTQGQVPLETTPSGSSYELKDPARGNHYTGDADHQADTCFYGFCLKRAPSTVFTDADNHWGDGTLENRQTVAVDAAYSTAETWDYYRDAHGRAGMAGDGAGSHSRVHYRSGYNNAFWDPRCLCMTYGDGDGVSYGPFASLDVVGHEITHGVVWATAKLIYAGESGGLNEATSDIFGTLVEFAANNPVDAPDYTLGEKVGLRGPLGWMDDPARDGRSASCWSPGVGELDVHHSAGVGNHFFYLLAVGSGASQWGDSPTCNGSTVVGIGNDAAAKIWYRALTVYMTSATNYAGARTATLNAARDLYGSTSVEHDAVAAAWLAVNVGPVAPAATLSVDDVAVDEGHSASTATFTVSLSAALAQPVSVGYATADGTATAPDDYTTATGSLSFAPGETVKTVPVSITGDTVHEGDETFTLNLSGPAGARLGDSTGLATIRDDDALTVSVSDVTVVEADGSATFLVSLSTASAATVTVDYATADGTALAGHDYSGTAGRLAFSPGDTAETVGVGVFGDDVDESSETFVLRLSNASAGTIADGEGVGAVVDDDGEPSVVVSNVALREGDIGTTPITFAVSLTARSAFPVTVDYSTADVTAVAPGDYASTTGTLAFAPGETTKTVTVTVNEDTVDEPDETFALNVSNPIQATIGDGQGTATIFDDDQPPSLSVFDSTVAEGNTATTQVEFNVSLSGASELAVTVDYSTADASAVAPDDYDASTGTLFFAPGETEKAVTVSVHGDNVDEADEAFGLNLSNATHATIGDAGGTATIVDDDASVSVSDAAVNEGNAGITGAEFTVSLSAVLERPVTVEYATADSTAVAPGDYVTSSGTLTFAPGETTRTVTVSVNGDTVDELDETFMLDVINVAGTSVADSRGFGTILDDDLAAPATSPVRAWGSNYSGQLGDGTRESRPSPGGVAGLSDVVALDAAYWHNLVVRSDGTVWGWGQNGRGLLGNGETTGATSPVQAIGVTDAVAVAGGSSHSLVLRADGTVWGMGGNRVGQLGPDRGAEYHTPVQVPGYADIVAIDVGDDFNLALRRDGTLWGSGSNGQGRLGNGTTTLSTSPVQVREGEGVLDDVVDMAAGWDYSVAVRSDGSVWAWGDDGDGISDDGDRLTAQPVPGLTNIVAVGAGAGHYLALRSDGTVWAWGNNSDGTVGNGTTNRFPDLVETPVQVQGLDDVVSIAAGNFHSLARRADGTVWAWGGNWAGQLGLGHTEHPQPLAVQVPGLSGVTAVSAGDEHSVVLVASSP